MTKYDNYLQRLQIEDEEHFDELVVLSFDVGFPLNDNPGLCHNEAIHCNLITNLFSNGDTKSTSKSICKTFQLVSNSVVS